MPHTLLYFIALFCLSTSPNWAKLNHMPVEILGFYRLALACSLLGIWILWRRQFTLLRPHKNLYWVILSGVFFFLHLWTYKYASKTTSVSNTMILFSSNPIWASLGAIAFFKEHLQKRLIISYLLALVGVYLLVAHDFNLSSENSRGDWAAVLSAVFYSAYMLTGKKARHHYDNLDFSLLLYGVCALCFFLCVLQTGAPLTGYDSLSWWAVVGLVALPTFLGHLSFTYLVKTMNLSLLSCGKLIEPVMASIMAYFIFHEVLSPYAWISFTLTTASVVILFAPALLRAIRK